MVFWVYLVLVAGWDPGMIKRYLYVIKRSLFDRSDEGGNWVSF